MVGRWEGSWRGNCLLRPAPGLLSAIAVMKLGVTLFVQLGTDIGVVEGRLNDMDGDVKIHSYQ